MQNAAYTRGSQRRSPLRSANKRIQMNWTTLSYQFLREMIMARHILIIEHSSLMHASFLLKKLNSICISQLKKQESKLIRAMLLSSPWVSLTSMLNVSGSGLLYANTWPFSCTIKIFKKTLSSTFQLEVNFCYGNFLLLSGISYFIMIRFNDAYHNLDCRKPE